MLQSSVKQLFPKFNDSLEFSRQIERRAKIKEVCHDLEFEGRVEDADNHDIEAFLVSNMPPALVCYNHKVASSTWISTFTKLYDTEYYEELSKTGAFYK